MLSDDMDFSDHNDLLKNSMTDGHLQALIDLVARTSVWVSPEIYKSVQVVYPKTRRKKGTGEKRGDIIKGIKLWDNQPAAIALWKALGSKPSNSSVCHIYEASVWDPKHFTNLANITGFPKGVASLSEWEPIGDVLKYHSYLDYGYTGPENRVPKKPDYYPKIWANVDQPDREEVYGRICALTRQSLDRPTFTGRTTHCRTPAIPDGAGHRRRVDLPDNKAYVTAAVAVWIATATLHQENRGRDAFSIKEITDRVQKQNLHNSGMSTIKAHIYGHCVANLKANRATHRKLYKTRGEYRLYRNGDDYHPSRNRGQAEPSTIQLPKEYHHLIKWYYDEYQ